MLVVAGRGCDEAEMATLSYGDSKRLLDGAVFKFRCHVGAQIVGPGTVFCDGNNWNDSKPQCLSKTKRQ